MVTHYQPCQVPRGLWMQPFMGSQSYSHQLSEVQVILHSVGRTGLDAAFMGGAIYVFATCR